MKCRWKAFNANFQKDIKFVAFHFIFGKYKNKNVTPSFGSKSHFGQVIRTTMKSQVLAGYKNKNVVPKTIFGPKSHFSYFHEFSLFVCNFCTSNMPNWTLSRDLSNDILFMSNWHHLHCVWKGGKWKESKGRDGISCIWIIEKKRNVCKTNPLGPHFAVRPIWAKKEARKLK